jgi:hypothetical protein
MSLRRSCRQISDGSSLEILLHPLVEYGDVFDQFILIRGFTASVHGRRAHSYLGRCRSLIQLWGLYIPFSASNSEEYYQEL